MGGDRTKGTSASAETATTSATGPASIRYFNNPRNTLCFAEDATNYPPL
jgi:hypothetical protein